MSPQEPALRTREDIELIEQVLWASRLAVSSTYELLDQAAAKNPEHQALCWVLAGNRGDQPVSLTYPALLGKIRQTAHLLADLGVGPQDVIALLLPNLFEMPLLLWGGQAAGIICPINPGFPPDQIVALLGAVKATVLVAPGPEVSQALWQKAEVVRRQVKSITTVLQVQGAGKEREGVYAFDALLADYPSDRLPTSRQIEPSDIAAYFHTRGTTGMPRAVPLTHGNQVYTAWALDRFLSLGPQEVMLCGLPLFHASGALVTGLAPLAQGASLVLLPEAFWKASAVPTTFWQIIEQYQVTCISAVPSLYRCLLQGLRVWPSMPSLRLALCTGDPLPAGVCAAFERQTGIPLLEGYGLTEGTAVSSMHPRDGGRKVGSIGLRLPYQQMKVVKLGAQARYVGDCQPNEQGVIVIKGPNVFTGYVQQTPSRDVFVADGWLNTGDLGRQDEDGYFWLTGRVEQSL